MSVQNHCAEPDSAHQGLTPDSPQGDDGPTAQESAEVDGQSSREGRRAAPPTVAELAATLHSSLVRLQAQIEQLRSTISEAGTLALGENGLLALRQIAANKDLRASKAIAPFQLIGRILLGVDGGLSARFASFAQAIYRPVPPSVEGRRDHQENQSEPTPTARPFTETSKEPPSNPALTTYVFSLPKDSAAAIAELLDAKWQARKRVVFTTRKVGGELRISRYLGTYDRRSESASLEVKARRRKNVPRKNGELPRSRDW